MKKKNGPPLPQILSWLAETPAGFLELEMKGVPKKERFINVAAVVNDLLFDAGGSFMEQKDLELFSQPADNKNQNYLKAVLILCHLFQHSYFIKDGSFSKDILIFLKSGEETFLKLRFRMLSKKRKTNGWLHFFEILKRNY